MKRILLVCAIIPLVASCNPADVCKQEVTNNATGDKFILKNSSKWWENDRYVSFDYNGENYRLTDYSIRSLCQEGRGGE